MKISIVTPSYNAYQTIEYTIQSVISQGYEDLEYIVLDSCSDDGTRSILEKYKDSISHLFVEKDEGQYFAIKRGLNIANGEVLGWLNADDLYMPWTLRTLNSIFMKFPEIMWIIGLPCFLNSQGECTKISTIHASSYPLKYIRNGLFRPPYASFMQQESMFWRKELFEKVGNLNTRFEFAADFELWIRFSKVTELYVLDIPLAAFRINPGIQKSVLYADKYHKEIKKITKELQSPKIFLRALYRRFRWLHYITNLLNLHQVNLVTFNKKNGWIIKKGYRPIARYSFFDLLSHFLN